MTIEINGQSFNFDEYSDVEINGYDLTITEEDFDEKSSKCIGSFIDKTLTLPPDIECRVNRTYLKPCSKVYQDNKGRKKLTAYFD